MTGRALSVLEFAQALEHVAGFASTTAGRDAVLALKPSGERDIVKSRLSAVAETMRFLERRGKWSFPFLPDASSALKRLAIDGSVLPAEGLARLGALLTAGRSVARSLAPAADTCPSLAALARRIIVEPDLEAAIGRAVDLPDNVLDTASRELARLRARLAGAHQRVVSHLESLLSGVSDRHRVRDASVTIRDGRYVIPVRREGKRALGGYIHDESSSGATVFVEPPSAIEMMNAVRETERAETREVQRILRELSDRCRPLAGALADSLDALAELDKRIALARTASRWKGWAPVVSEGDLVIVQGRHPLLAARGEAVPFDLDLAHNEGVVVVTGPNAGGKTVFLKSVGLIAALAQSGVIPPVGPGTRLPVFDSLFADVGDEQSIARSLSTFSAHIQNLKEIVNEAGAASLVLIDEPGTGTDPREGEALARALIEKLAELGCTAVVTSHLGGLKRLAAPGNRIVNASLHFDGERMAPTFQFCKGRPGRSYGLAIARGLGFSEEILDSAVNYRDRAEVRLDGLLESLEKKERRAAGLMAELARERESVAALQNALDLREENLRAAEREHRSAARDNARRLLLAARAEVDAAVARLTAQVEAGDAVREAARAARRRVEDAAQTLAATSADPADPVAAGAPPTGSSVPLAPGSDVLLAVSGARGTLVAVEG